MKYEVVGTFTEVNALRKLPEYEKLIEGRAFSRWYAKNKKKVDALAGVAVFGLMTALRVSPFFLAGTLLPPVAIPVAVVGKFFDGYGVILLHMLIIGFLTLVVTTFLKFTGRGDLAPLVMFVGGAIILYECMGLFNAIYKGVQVFFNM